MRSVANVLALLLAVLVLALLFASAIDLTPTNPQSALYLQGAPQ